MSKKKVKIFTDLDNNKNIRIKFSRNNYLSIIGIIFFIYNYDTFISLFGFLYYLDIQNLLSFIFHIYHNDIEPINLFLLFLIYLFL